MERLREVEREGGREKQYFRMLAIFLKRRELLCQPGQSSLVRPLVAFERVSGEVGGIAIVAFVRLFAVSDLMLHETAFARGFEDAEVAREWHHASVDLREGEEELI